ncbi:hypothetical protein ACFQ5J_04300 [Lacticaseibacillus baoqingensis]|uniref:DUF1659 domain-containing protein n=1 Tax=Lacticaseibacillus baoqingensis TaxID=2486013 RepID=A0ABW4E5Q6_9LACO|nr:hypothetical protein [Lacticaseibacillus baoqingensis]
MARTTISNSVRIRSVHGDDPNASTTRAFSNLIIGITDVQLQGIERIVNSFDEDLHGSLLLSRVDEINPE